MCFRFSTSAMVFHYRKIPKPQAPEENQSFSKATGKGGVPKGFVAVYVGEIQKKRFVIPVSYLNHPLFQDLLRRAEEEFGFYPPLGGLTIPYNEDAFVDLTCRINGF
uniref:Auxin-responsive protein SAUR21-like n=1 Tax=Nelumbo nucifera TaxID=4432 RepID=A0A822ZQ34_NELNU|nr:TPA_asm: hypothetical protein HUJ06_016944 [Nelumbo nucifera]